MLVLVGVLVGCSPAETESRQTTSTGGGIGFGTLADAEKSLLIRTLSGPHADLIVTAVDEAVNSSYRYHSASLQFHQDVFSDGVVTRSEYERAKFASADCMRQRGHNVMGPIEFGPDTGIIVVVGGDPRDYLHWLVLDPGPSADADTSLCQELWDFIVGSVWVRVHQPSESDKQIWLEAAWACAKAKGLAMSEPPSERNAIDAVAFGCEPWNALAGG